MTMTPDDSARLQGLGLALLNNLASLSIITLLHGMFIIVFSIVVHTTLHRELKSRPTLMIFILIILSFTGATIYWAAWIANVAIQIRWVLVKNYGMELSEKMALADAAMHMPGQIQLFLSPFLWVINDSVVIWRAWVLFPGCRWVMAGPLFFLLMTFVMILTYLVTHTTTTLSAKMYNIIANSTLAMSMVTNLLATLLIAYKLWDYQKAISNLGLKKTQSRVQKVLFLLVESGVLFLGLQLASLLLALLTPLSTTSTASDHASRVCNVLYVELAAMYPSLILIIVNKERSFASSIVFGSNLNGEGDAKPATIGHLVFASPPTKGTVVDNKSLPRHSTVPGSPESSGSCLA